MTVLEQIALAWQGVVRTLALLPRPATWAPWLLLGALQAGFILLVWNAAHPAVSPVMAPLVRALAGDAALHYPELFRVLPSIYTTVDLVFGAVAGALVVGAATRIFANRFLGRPAAPAAALREALGRFWPLFLARLPFHLVALLFGLGLGGWLDSQRRSFMVQTLGALLVIAGSLVAQALFFFVAALVVLERRSAWAALTELPRTWARGFWGAMFLGLLLVLALLPFHLLHGQAGIIAERGRPELIAALSVAQALFALMLWYVLAGSATLVYLVSMARRPEDR